MSASVSEHRKIQETRRDTKNTRSATAVTSWAIPNALTRGMLMRVGTKVVKRSPVKKIKALTLSSTTNSPALEKITTPAVLAESMNCSPVQLITMMAKWLSVCMRPSSILTKHLTRQRQQAEHRLSTSLAAASMKACSIFTRLMMILAKVMDPIWLPVNLPTPVQHPADCLLKYQSPAALAIRQTIAQYRKNTKKKQQNRCSTEIPEAVSSDITLAADKRDTPQIEATAKIDRKKPIKPTETGVISTHRFSVRNCEVSLSSRIVLSKLPLKQQHRIKPYTSSKMSMPIARAQCFASKAMNPTMTIKVKPIPTLKQIMHLGYALRSHIQANEAPNDSTVIRMIDAKT